MDTVTYAPPPKGKKNYGGKVFPEKWPDWNCELYIFGISKPGIEGKKKYESFKRLVGMLWPDPIFFWDRWAQLMFSALCGYKEGVEEVTGVTIEADYEWWTQVMGTGAAATGKSSRAAMWVLVNWLVSRDHTSGILTSTSLDQLKRRIWSELLHWVTDCKFKLPLEVVPSDTIIRYDGKDTKHAIFGRAVDQGGSVDNAVGRIKGVHARRVFVVVDELTAMPEAIAIACRNLDSGTDEFQLIGLGNATDHADQHGLHCEPVGGWSSISEDCEFWLTKYGGCCVHLDGHKSPAVLEDPEKYRFYIGPKKLERDRRFMGGENTPEYWRENRGFWCPTGLSNTIMDTALLDQFEANKPAIWKNGFAMGASLDPAFEGGDRRILTPFKFGEFTNGITGAEILPAIAVGIDMTQDVRWIHYQISDAVQKICEEYKLPNRQAAPIPPEHFIQDTTGEGGGLFSVLSGRWSPKIISEEFGGAAEKTQIFPDRPTTYHELYGNKVTMLWYVFRRFVEGGQIRGLTDVETRTELTGREKIMRNGKLFAQPKKEMKAQKHKSPDKADGAVLVTSFLRRRGVVPAGSTGGGEVLSLDRWNEKADEMSPDEEVAYSQDSYA